MSVCSSCGKGLSNPHLRVSPVLVVKEQITQNEIQFDTVFLQSFVNKNGYDEKTSSFYLSKEFGMAGLQLPSFNLTNYYMHVLPKGGRKKEEREIPERCEEATLTEFLKVAKDKRIIFMMGASLIKKFTGHNASEVYGLPCKSELLPDAWVIIPAPNSDKLMNSPIGEMRLAIKSLAEQIKIYKEYKEI